MARCGQCGRENPQESAACFDCGAPLAPENAARPAGGRALSGTVLGMPSPLRPNSVEAPKHEREESPSTLRGAGPERAPPSATSDRADLRSTALGLGSPFRPATPASSPETPPRAPVEPRNEFSGTLLGHASPVRGTAPSAAVRTAELPPSNAKTIMGIARPGIAPERPASAPQANESPASPRRAALEEMAIPGLRGRPTPPRRALGFAALGLGVLGLGGLAVFALRAKTPERALAVTTFEALDETTDALSVECRGCSPNARVRLDGEWVSFERGRARVRARRLALGEQQLAFHLEDGESHETLTTSVPVHFRVVAAWRTDGENVRGEVEVRARPGAEVEIDGRRAALENGLARHSFALGAETRGESDRTEKLERILPVLVRTDGKTLAASAVLVGRVPLLRLLTPAPHHATTRGEVTVSGRTEPLAVLRASSKESTADEKGDFSFAVPVEPSTRSLQVTATAPGTLPRFATVPLDPRGSPPPQDARTTRGKVVEARVHQERTTLLLETNECADPPCLLRVVFGEPLTLQRGRWATAIGSELPGNPPTFRASRLSSP